MADSLRGRRLVSCFVAGQKAFRKLTDRHAPSIVVLDLSNSSLDPTIRNNLNQPSDPFRSNLLVNHDPAIECPLEYKQYSWEEQWDRTRRPFVTIQRYPISSLDNLPQLTAILSVVHSYETIIVQLDRAVNEAVGQFIKQLEEGAAHVYLYQKDSAEVNSDIVNLLHRMWEKLLPVYMEEDGSNDHAEASLVKIENSSLVSAVKIYTSDNVVLLFNRIVNHVTVRYNREILSADGACSVWFSLQDLWQISTGHCRGAMELLYDTLLAVAINWHELYTCRVEELKVHVSGRIFLVGKSLDFVSNQEWREEAPKPKPFLLAADRHNLWTIGCLVLRFHGLDVLCDDLLKHLPNLEKAKALRPILEDFHPINNKLTSTEFPDCSYPSMRCLVQMCFQESLYFPLYDGYASVIKYFQFLLNGDKWSKDRDRVLDCGVMGIWGRSSTHRHGIGYRSLFLVRKNENMVFGKGRSTDAVCRFLEETESGGQLISANVAGKKVEGYSESDIQVHSIEIECSEDFLRALLELRHPNIVEHLAFGQEITCGTTSLVPIRATHILMETYAENLLTVINKIPNRMTEDVVLRFITQICTGVAYLHTLPCPIIHGDLKSENVLLTQCEDLLTAVAKICDIDGGAFRNDNPKQWAEQRTVDTRNRFLRAAAYLPEMALQLGISGGKLLNADTESSALKAQLSDILSHLSTKNGGHAAVHEARDLVSKQLSDARDYCLKNPNSPVVSLFNDAVIVMGNEFAKSGINGHQTDEESPLDDAVIQFVDDYIGTWSEHSNVDGPLGACRKERSSQLNCTHRAFTPRYAAPEVIMADKIDGRFDESVDIWSLGCILLEMHFKGQFPFVDVRGRVFYARDCVDTERLKNKIESMGGTPVVPETLPPLLQVMAKGCIQRDAAKRSSAVYLCELLTQPVQQSEDCEPDSSSVPAEDINSESYSSTIFSPYLEYDRGIKFYVDLVHSIGVLSGRDTEYTLVAIHFIGEACEHPVDVRSKGPEIVFAAGVCPEIIRLLKHPDERIVYEAVRILCTITEKAPARCHALVELGMFINLRHAMAVHKVADGVQIKACHLLIAVADASKHLIKDIVCEGIPLILAKLTRTGPLECRSMAEVAFGVLLSACSDEERIMIDNAYLESGRLEENAQFDSNRSTEAPEETATPALSPALKMTLDLIGFHNLLACTNEQETLATLNLLTEACNVQSTYGIAHAFYDAGLTPQLIQLLRHENRDILRSSLRLIASITQVSATTAQTLIDLQLLHHLRAILTEHEELQDSCCSVIAALVKTAPQLIQALMDAGLTSLMLGAMRSVDGNGRKEAALALAALYMHATDAQKRSIETFGKDQTAVLEELNDIIRGN